MLLYCNSALLTKPNQAAALTKEGSDVQKLTRKAFNINLIFINFRRPSGTPSLDQAALDTPCLLSACATLEPELAASDAEVKLLMDEAEKLQKEIAEADKEIEKCISA